jgi:hypothetical protein
MNQFNIESNNNTPYRSDERSDLTLRSKRENKILRKNKNNEGLLQKKIQNTHISSCNLGQ